MADWVLEVNPLMPVGVFTQVTSLLEEFPGDDELLMQIGAAQLRVPVCDSRGLRAELLRVGGEWIRETNPDAHG